MTTEKKVDAMCHMVSPDGRAGVVPESRTADALDNGFEFATALRDPESGEIKYVPRSQVAMHRKKGFTHLHDATEKKLRRKESKGRPGL